LGVFLIVLMALSAGAYLFFARSAHELLEPLLGLPEGQAAYAATLRRAALTIALFDVPLIIVVGLAAYVLARLSIRPLLAAREREERFAADAAHELRTPLATIAALAQAARAADGDSAAQNRAFAKITDTALDASELLGDLLALMRDAPDEQRLREPVDVTRLVAAVVGDVAPAAPNVRIEITAPADGAYVIGDERALRQLAHNLVVNAVRHARQRVLVAVSAQARSIVLTVEDDGDGVAPGDRERIFERFFKAQPNSPGSGLGLAICRHIATRHGGTVVLEERARFVARLPKAVL
jgi:two-component system OmpR family sensor kinase